MQYAVAKTVLIVIVIVRVIPKTVYDRAILYGKYVYIAYVKTLYVRDFTSVQRWHERTKQVDVKIDNDVSQI